MLAIAGAAAAVAVPKLISPSAGTEIVSATAAPVQTAMPTAVPTVMPTAVPTAMPTAVPTVMPTAVPTAAPTAVQEGPSRSIHSVDDLDALVKWMIETNTLDVKLDGLAISDDQVKAALRRNPEVDKYSWSSASVKLTLTTGTQIVAAIRNGDEAQLSAEAAEIARKARQTVSALISSGMSDLEKEIALHDYIIYNCDYEINPSLHTEDVRGFYHHGRVQCSGYSDVFRLLGYLSGLEIRSVSGDIVGETGGHEWNLIRLDGLWYVVDVTWDDPIGGGKECHMYLNIPNRLLDSDHIYDAAALPGGTFAQNFDRNFYYGRQGILASSLAEAEQLLRSQLASGRQAEVCSVVGEMDINALVKKILDERGGSWGWNTSYMEGLPGVVHYKITIK